jgi:putative ubiquitin-RnfH superfamily antitoxin RatB of RatAB toxin-antitoxin module
MMMVVRVLVAFPKQKKQKRVSLRKAALNALVEVGVLQRRNQLIEKVRAHQRGKL